MTHNQFTAHLFIMGFSFRGTSNYMYHRKIGQWTEYVYYDTTGLASHQLGLGKTSAAKNPKTVIEEIESHDRNRVQRADACSSN